MVAGICMSPHYRVSRVEDVGQILTTCRCRARNLDIWIVGLPHFVFAGRLEQSNTRFLSSPFIIGVPFCLLFGTLN